MYAKNVEKDILYVPNPECFGNLLTPKYVLTTVTCFIDEKGWEKVNNVLLNLKEKFLSGHFLRSDIEEFIFVMVNKFFDIQHFNSKLVNYYRFFCEKNSRFARISELLSH